MAVAAERCITRAVLFALSFSNLRSCRTKEGGLGTRAADHLRARCYSHAIADEVQAARVIVPKLSWLLRCTRPIGLHGDFHGQRQIKGSL
jgi:hypothetical protein